MAVITISQSQEMEKGEWYLTVACSSCAAPVPIVHDPSQGKLSMSFTPDIEFDVTCAKCGKRDRYPAQKAKRAAAS